ncbi:MAG: quinol:cytochrome C oxidoreductase [Flavobacteriales bacterium]
MFKFPFGLKVISGILMIVGLLAFAVGIYQSNTDAHDIKENGYESKYLKEHHQHQKEISDEMVAIGDNPAVVLEDHNAETEAKHIHHAYNQIKNKPWTAVYIAVIMFLLISIGSLFFLAVQHAASVGWSVILIRVMEGIATYLPIGGVIFFILLVISGMHFNHLFHWMDDSLLNKYMIVTDGTKEYVAEMIEGAVPNPDYDSILAGKEAYLNVSSWLIRATIYIGGWIFFLFKLKGLSMKLDANPFDRRIFISQRNWSAGFIVFFAVTSSMLAWDWIMSFDPHWFSTLFGWYTFASYMCCVLAVIILVSVFLKSQGVFPEFNDNHLHDLTKYMFGFSLLWAYLWFSQFMLIWYANIPEEVTYYYARFDEHKIQFLGMLIPNFVLPLLVLVSSSIKRNYKVVCFMAFVVIFGHYLDFFIMMEPGSVGSFAQIGFAEIGAFLFFAGLFIFVVFTALTKRPSQPKGNPLHHESEIYHYPF